MVFSSTVFLFVFLPILLALYFLPFKNDLARYWKNTILFIFSIIFYAWGEPFFVFIMLVSILINWYLVLKMERSLDYKKVWMLIAILIDLSILGIFKYLSFISKNIAAFTGNYMFIVEIVLPIGISFFTFQEISYVIDVYRKDVPVQKNIFKVGLYIMLFPQLIAGPIVRYKDIAKEIDSRYTSIDDFCYGIQRFIFGLGKKVIIANTMASLVDSIWNNGADANIWSVAWIGSIAYTLQIYFDFSGYSDMAIGLGRMFGFHFSENFKLPYISKSISEFWRRWHISLSSWFKDYVYIPLGGNRKNVYLNLAIVFLLTGIWHGAAWHYIVWGIWNGIFVLIERRLKDKSKDGPSNKIIKGNIKCLLMRLYSLAVVNFGWILFRAPYTKDALQYMATMFGIIKPEKPGFTFWWYLDRWTLTIMFIGILFASDIPSKIRTRLGVAFPNKVTAIFKFGILSFVLYFSIMRIVSGTYNPFIYFQF